MIATIGRVKEVATTLGSSVAAAVPKTIASTAVLRAFGLFKIPMIFFVGPTVTELSDERCVVRIPLRPWTRNHLKAMYLGALAVGADVAAGLFAFDRIRTSGVKVDLLFKDMHADFKKRVEGDAYFTCNDGRAVDEAVRRAIDAGERVNISVPVTVTVPDALGDEPAAVFTMTLTLKRRRSDS